MSILASIHINQYLVVQKDLKFQVQYSYFFPGTSNYLRKFHQHICFFIGLRTLKPTRTRTLNRISIWHGLTIYELKFIHSANAALKYSIPRACSDFDVYIFTYCFCCLFVRFASHSKQVNLFQLTTEYCSIIFIIYKIHTSKMASYNATIFI